MPSAVACITSPRVVDNVPLGREGVEEGGEDVEERSEREYMLWVRWDGWAGASDGIMSIRYISINPRIKEMPIQACGVWWDLNNTSDAIAGSLGSSRTWTSPDFVGVRGGSSSASVLIAPSGGITGPGSAGMASDPTVTCLLAGIIGALIGSSCRGIVLRPCHRMSKDIGNIALFACECAGCPALYSVSTPSGMITIRDVPTSTPIPTVEMTRS